MDTQPEQASRCVCTSIMHIMLNQRYMHVLCTWLFRVPARCLLADLDTPSKSHAKPPRARICPVIITRIIMIIIIIIVATTVLNDSNGMIGWMAIGIDGGANLPIDNSEATIESRERAGTQSPRKVIAQQ
jgi:hypothetical protein